MSAPADLVTTRAAARRLGIAPNTLLNWVRGGRLVPVLELPGDRGQKLFDPADVEALREQLKAEALARFDTEATA